MNSSSIVVSIVFFWGMLLMMPSQGIGQNFVYQPTSPAFGGHYLNYQWLMSSANTQNQYKESQDFGLNNDPMANFQNNLQRQVLSELTQGIVRDKLGDNFDFSQENTLEFGDFSIDVIPSGDGVSFRIFDAITGDQTSITIPNI